MSGAEWTKSLQGKIKAATAALEAIRDGTADPIRCANDALMAMAPKPKGGDGANYQWLVDHVGYQGDDCLIWPFARDPRCGRGQLGYRGKGWWAHRLMCQLAHGPAPSKHQAGHSCGKGHNACVNPRHLSWKTNTQNQLDRREHGTVLESWTRKFNPERIAELRALRPAMTQMQLAERFGCSLGTVQYYLKYREQRGCEPVPGSTL